MSEYHTLEVEFKDEESLVDALKEIGYQPEVHAEPVGLTGYQGDKRSQKAHIVIPRKQVGSASNDVGYLRKIDGKYELHVSEYDRSGWQNKTKKLQQLYAKNVILKQAKKSKYKLSSQTQDADGSLRIKLKIKSGH